MLAHMMLAAVNEAALLIARADDPKRALAEGQAARRHHARPADGRMTAFVTAGAGFLLAVLWFDLMFDVQVLRRPRSRTPAEALESISAYYRRVTTAARPMNLLIGAVMAGMLGAIVAQIATDDVADWAGWASLALGGSAIALAATHTYPAAVRLGRRADPVQVTAPARAVDRPRPPALPGGDRVTARDPARGRRDRLGPMPEPALPQKVFVTARTGSSAGCWSSATGRSAAR